MCGTGKCTRYSLVYGRGEVSVEPEDEEHRVIGWMLEVTGKRRLSALHRRNCNPEITERLLDQTRGGNGGVNRRIKKEIPAR